MNYELLSINYISQVLTFGFTFTVAIILGFTSICLSVIVFLSAYFSSIELLLLGLNSPLEVGVDSGSFSPVFIT